MRMARLRTSGENLFVVLLMMAPLSQKLEPPANPERFNALDWGITSVASHPGIARTDLLHNSSGRSSLQGLLRTYAWFLFQPAARGALPLLYAATDPSARAGAYYGPDGWSEMRGYPTIARMPEHASDIGVASKLWDVSQVLSNVRFDDFALQTLSAMKAS
jgi:hypothetical protein